MNDLPGFSFLDSRYPEVLLVVFMSAALVAPILTHLIERALAAWRARRDQRELDAATDYLMRVGFLARERQRQAPEDTQ